MRMIVRSHELVHSGWAIAGKKDVITVFSAVDYRNTGNDGAFLPPYTCWQSNLCLQIYLLVSERGAKSCVCIQH